MTDEGAEPRICVRCGRVGSYAFRPVASSSATPAWMCSHEGPCLERLRADRRRRSRDRSHRPRTSQITPEDLSERPACVIGSDEESIAHISALLSEFGGAEVERLPLDRRALNRLPRLGVSVVVVDSHASDPIALVNELTRRLGALAERGTPVVVCRSSGTSRPSTERLIQATAARTAERPFDASSLMVAVRSAMDAAASDLAAG